MECDRTRSGFNRAAIEHIPDNVQIVCTWHLTLRQYGPVSIKNHQVVLLTDGTICHNSRSKFCCRKRGGIVSYILYPLSRPAYRAGKAFPEQE